MTLWTSRIEFINKRYGSVATHETVGPHVHLVDAAAEAIDGRDAADVQRSVYGGRRQVAGQDDEAVLPHGVCCCNSRPPNLTAKTFSSKDEGNHI